MALIFKKMLHMHLKIESIKTRPSASLEALLAVAARSPI
jgi:hypothetical protein